MTRDDFVKQFKVGDKVTANHWADGAWLEIIFIGSKKFFAKNDLGTENIWDFNKCNWLPYTEPQKQKKTIKMAQGVMKNLLGHYIVSPILFLSKKECEDYFNEDKIIQWPIVINEVEQWITVEVEE